MILGLTGAIGCGKSTVIELFQNLNWQIFDADACCHQLCEDPKYGIVDFLKKTWGSELFNTTGKINRPALAAQVFSHPAELKKLVDVLYPELDRQLTAHIAQARAQQAHAVYEIPLLFENGYEKFFEAILTVWSPEDLRHARLRQYRNFTEADIVTREAQQLSADAKLARADYALINNGTRQELKQQLLDLVASF